MINDVSKKQVEFNLSGHKYRISQNQYSKNMKNQLLFAKPSILSINLNKSLIFEFES